MLRSMFSECADKATLAVRQLPLLYMYIFNLPSQYASVFFGAYQATDRQCQPVLPVHSRGLAAPLALKQWSVWG